MLKKFVVVVNFVAVAAFVAIAFGVLQFFIAYLNALSCLTAPVSITPLNSPKTQAPHPLTPPPTPTTPFSHQLLSNISDHILS